MEKNGQNRPEGHGEGLIPKHGGYRRLKSFQVARLVHDVTVRFCDRFIEKRSRTHDQMVQAARSGVQNIAEGSVASGTSKKMELKLTNVAKASLEELRLDYEDFLRQRGLAFWAPDDPRRRSLVDRRCSTADEVAAWVVEVARREVNGEDGQNGQDRQDGLDGLDGLNGQNGQPNHQAPPIPSTPSILSIPSTPSMPSMLYPAISANAALVLIGVAVSLLDRQISAQAKAFETEGGFTERLYKTRRTRRNSE